MPVTRFLAAAILSIFILLAPVRAQAPAESVQPIEYVGVVEVPGVSASELFVRAKVWFADTFVDSKHVLEVQDKDAGVLAGKGSIHFVPHFLVARDLVAGEVTFNIKVLVKDGRFKYMFTDFVHRGTPSSMAAPIDFGLLTTAKNPPDVKNIPKGNREKAWDELHQLVEAHATLAIAQLKQQMAAAPGGNSNW